MRKKKLTLIATSLFFVLLLIPNNPVLSSGDHFTTDLTDNYSSQIAVTTDPYIEINDDADFLTEGFTGDGSSGNPYTLDGETISYTLAEIIAISNTRANFSITNCVFTGYSMKHSISLSNASNGFFYNNTFNEAFDAFHISNCTNIVIEENEIINSNNAIYLWDSPEVKILDCYIYDCNRGVYARGTPEINITSNKIEKFAIYGITINVEGINSFIKGNLLSYGTGGVAIHCQGDSSIMEENGIFNCISTAIYGYLLNNAIIRYNEIRNVSENGIHLLVADNNDILNNDLRCVEKVGIRITDSLGNDVWYNRMDIINDTGILLDDMTQSTLVYQNQVFAARVTGVNLTDLTSVNTVTENIIGWNGLNGNDDGTLNQWNSSATLSLGNWWSDNSGAPFYTVSGTAGSIDYHPQDYVDNTAPIFQTTDVSPEPYFATTTGHYINWSFSDSHPYSWVLELDGIEVDNGCWCNDFLYRDVDGLSIGEYNYTLVITDAAGNNTTDTVILTVEPYDGDSPIIESYGNQILEAGLDSITLHWNGSDSYPSHYILYRNGTELKNGTYASDTNVSYVVSIQDVSVWNFTCWFNDTLGNSDSASVILQFIDSTNPTVNDVMDFEVEFGTTNNDIEWTPNDIYPESYTVYRNNQVVATGSWNSSSESIVIDLDSLSIDNYNFTIEVVDQSGNTGIDQVQVVVEDTTTPSIDHPSDIQYTSGTTGNNLSWTVSDLHQSYYLIYRNGSLLLNETWDSGTIEISIDDLSEGLWNFTILCYDDY